MSKVRKFGFTLRTITACTVFQYFFPRKPDDHCVCEMSKGLSYDAWQLFHSDGFGKVAWLVHIAALHDGNMVGEQLQRNYGEER